MIQWRHIFHFSIFVWYFRNFHHFFHFRSFFHIHQTNEFYFFLLVGFSCCTTTISESARQQWCNTCKAIQGRWEHAQSPDAESRPNTSVLFEPTATAHVADPTEKQRQPEPTAAKYFRSVDEQLPNDAATPTSNAPPTAATTTATTTAATANADTVTATNHITEHTARLSANLAEQPEWYVPL